MRLTASLFLASASLSKPSSRRATRQKRSSCRER